MILRLGMRELFHALSNSSCWTTTLVLQQFVVMLNQSTPYFVSITLISPQIYRTVQTCVSRSSMQGKEKKTLPGNEAPSHVRCLLPCSNWPRSLQLIQLKLLLLTGSPSSESLVWVVLNMLRKHSQLLMSTNTLQANVSSKPSSQPTRKSTIAAALSFVFTYSTAIYKSSRRSWKSLSKSRRTGRMVNQSCLLPATLIQTYVRSKRHIKSTSYPKD